MFSTASNANSRHYSYIFHIPLAVKVSIMLITQEPDIRLEIVLLIIQRTVRQIQLKEI